MFRTSVAVVAVALLPSLVVAQARSRDRGAKDNSEALSQSMPTGPKLSARDIEGSSPLKFLIDKRKDLKLTDDQLKQFKEMDAKQREKDAPSYKAVDSLVKMMKPSTSVQTAEDEARVVIARDALMNVLREVRTSDDAAATEAVAGLDDSQKTIAAELLKKQRQETEQMVRGKLNSGGGFGGPGGGGGRRGQ